MSQVIIEGLQVEHHPDGFGIGHSRPRISWKYAETEIKDWHQSAYELKITRHDHEDTFHVDSEDCVLVAWPGQNLASRGVAKLEVRARGKDMIWTDWVGLTIECSLLEGTDWKSKWIAGVPTPLDEPKPPVRFISPSISLSTPQRARLYVTAQGLYEVCINGTRLNEQLLSPGWTSYHHNINFQTYDVTALLVAGANRIGAYVAEGWYAGRLGRKGTKNLWGTRPSLLLQLEVDGDIVCTSNESWGVVSNGPVLSSEIYNGETFDTRFDNPDWMDDPSTEPVCILTDSPATLHSSDMPPVRRLEVIPARKIITSPSGKQIIDFGQNLVGWVRIEKHLGGNSGSLVTIRHAEVLEDGELGTRPLWTAKCTDTIIPGGPTQGWEPRFTYHGFRYVEITGLTEFDLSTFSAVTIATDLPRTGHFECSHSQLNQLHHNIVKSAIGNFVTLPTDCPQRDERLGWLGDFQIFCPTANFLFDTTGFIDNWFRDIRAEQQEWKGVVPLFSPFFDFLGAIPQELAIWGDTIAITPWDLYQTFKDTKFLDINYQAMVDWLAVIPKNESGLWAQSAPQFGDWLDPRAAPQFPAHGPTDTHLVSDMYLIHTTRLVGDIGRLLGKPGFDVYHREAARLRALFRETYVSPKGRVSSDTQTALGYLVRWGCFKINTGFLGTPVLLPVLAKVDKLSTAYRMLQEKDCPSWLYPVSMGATTIWERWDSMLPSGKIHPGTMTSFNHYALGSVGHFLHTVVGGLAADLPGWKRALVQPRPGGTVTHAKTKFLSPYGLYSVAWNLVGESLRLRVRVPPNGSARVVLPDLERVIGSGDYFFESASAADPSWPPRGVQGIQKTKLPDEFVP